MTQTSTSSKTSSFNTPRPVNVLGAKPTPKKPAKKLAGRIHYKTGFKQNLMLLVSAAALSLASAPSAFAQNNDVDAYNAGSTNADCPGQSPIQATPTNVFGSTTPLSRQGNIVGGNAHCIGDDSDDNIVNGDSNTLGALSSRNVVSGNRNNLGENNDNNTVSGFSNTLEDNVNESIVGGRQNTIGGSGNLVTGSYNRIEGATNNAVNGSNNVLGDYASRNSVSGLRNTLNNQATNNAVSGQYNTIGIATDFGADGVAGGGDDLRRTPE